MSAIVSAVVAGTTALVAVAAAAVPEISGAARPLFEVDPEFTSFAAAVIFGVPGLAVLTMLANATRD